MKFFLRLFKKLLGNLFVILVEKLFGKLFGK